MSTVFHATKNEAVGQLASPYTAGAGALVLSTGQGTRFGTPSPSAPIWITARSGTDGTGAVLGHWQATGRTGDTLTSVTAASGYSDASLAAGTWVRILWTAEHVAELQTAINTAEVSLTTHATNTSNPHSTTAAQVGAYTTTQVDTLLSGVVHLTGAETIHDEKTFSAPVTAATYQGSTSAFGDVTILSTGHASKGKVYLNGTTTYVSATGSVVCPQGFVGPNRLRTEPSGGLIFANSALLQFEFVNSAEGSVGYLWGSNVDSLDIFTASYAYPIKIDGSLVQINTVGSGKLLLGHINDYADDSAAAGGSVPVGGVYRTGSALKIRAS